VHPGLFHETGQQTVGELYLSAAWHIITSWAGAVVNQINLCVPYSLFALSLAAMSMG
jgi:hypothetical protein